MSQVSFTDAKERIRQAVDIVDLIGGYLSLRRQGRNYVGLCPYHDDTRPSMQVNQERQTWKCWVCDKGGDIFTWVMEKEKLGFREALQQLADRANIQLETNVPRAAPGSPDDKKTLLECCEWAEKQFHEHLLRSESAEIGRKYVEERGITPASVEKFKLGLAPNEWQWLIERAKRTSFTPAVLEAAGLVGRSANGDRPYDFFKGRVIFPIHDPAGRCIAFGGRILPQWAEGAGGKYLNGRETKLFSKSDQLYALHIARHHNKDSRSLTVVEGYTDVVMCHQHGVQDVVACLGTALNQRHIALIKRFADRVNLVLDGDEAGQSRTNAVLDLFVAAQVDLWILSLPDEFDPCEFLLEKGADAWRSLLTREAVDAIEHRVRTATRGLDLINDTFRANQALENILQTIARAPRPTLVSAGQQQLREKQIVARLARAFALEIPDVTGRLEELRKSAKPANEPAAEGRVTRRGRGVDFDAFQEAELLGLLARHPELAPTALSELADNELSDVSIRIIFRTYRRLEEAGESLEFASVLSELEDPEHQSLLVGYDEQEAARAETCGQDPAARMRSLINFIRKKYDVRDRRETEAELENKTLAHEEQDSLLSQILEQAKRRHQGMNAPTEG